MFNMHPISQNVEFIEGGRKHKKREFIAFLGI